MEIGSDRYLLEAIISSTCNSDLELLTPFTNVAGEQLTLAINKKAFKSTVFTLGAYDGSLKFEIKLTKLCAKAKLWLVQCRQC